MTAVAPSRVKAAPLAPRDGLSIVRPLAWFALALIGEIARLQLIAAGHLVGYQHYLRPAEMLAAQPMAAAIVVAQGIIAALGLRRSWPVLRSAVSERYGGWRLAAIAAVFMLFSATLSKEPAVFGTELLLATVLQAIALATIICAAASVPRGLLDAAAARTSTLRGGMPDEAGVRADGFIWTLALWTVVVCAALALLSYQAHPHVPDEVSYIFQARYFAQGMLEMAPPPVAAAFDLDLMTFEADRWYSPVPPGWPAVLSLGYLAGAPWLVNPLLNGANVLLAYLVVGDVYGRSTARWSAILLASSPWFLFMGMNFMTHTSALCVTLVAALAVARMRRSGALGWGVVGGVAIGGVSLIRPLEGLAVAVLLGFWGLGGRSRFPIALPQVAVLALATMAVGALVLLYNAAVAGDPTVFPLMAYTDAMYGPDVNALGFGANRGIGWPGLDPFPGHGILDVFINGALNGFQVNVELLGWSIGSLLPIALLVFSGRLLRQDWWMLASIAVIVGLHSFYWFAGGPDFGARYWYLIIVPCIALAARGIETAAALAVNRAPDDAPAVRVALGALALCVMAVAVFVPWRAVDKYYHYRGMEPGVEQLARAHGFGESLVLVRGRRHPDYASAATYNPLDFRAPGPIYAWDRSPEVRADVLRAYPDRPVWIVAGPTETGRGYQVLAGPLSARQALEWNGGGAAHGITP
jgi:4-amino-4-deoxy-L-arabinose transferase-like glycosyltransferase